MHVDSLTCRSTFKFKHCRVPKQSGDNPSGVWMRGMYDLFVFLFWRMPVKSRLFATPLRCHPDE